jgi:hypothetical protein
VPRRTGSGARGVALRWAQTTVTTAALGLILFHVGLLVADTIGGRLLDPVVGTRWLAGLALFVLLLALRRLGVSLLWGRRAAVLWLLVVLLHGSVGLEAEPPGATARPTAEGMVLAIAPVLTLGFAGLAAAMVARLRSQPLVAVPLRRVGCAFSARGDHLAWSDALRVLHVPRPPPAS